MATLAFHILKPAQAKRIDDDRTIDLARYQEEGVDTRSAYLEQLAAEHDVPVTVLAELAEMLGPEEDFDGLVTTVEDNWEQMQEAGS